MTTSGGPWCPPSFLVPVPMSGQSAVTSNPGPGQFAEQLMSAEADAICGADYGQVGEPV
ncbi:hypothetical protein [Streptosporangium vulgare]|uniref:Uncharacterized protein n=1 Tax=Streptosporangium vulgare TaxID=46190 RepID=A0ABV5TH75_9ACTN